MNRKMYWGIGALILLIGIVGLYFILQPDPEPITVYNAPSEDVIKQAQQANSPPRPAKPGYKWEWHDDHWDEIPIAQSEATPSVPPMLTENTVHLPSLRGDVRPDLFDRLATYNGIVLSPKVISFSKAPAGIDFDWASMPPEEVEKAIDDIENERHFPPAGYEYLWDPDDISQLALDENGYPILHTRGEPQFFYDPPTGFLPSPEQYKEYKRLKAAAKAELEGRSADEKRLRSQLSEIQFNSGEKPGYSISISRETDGGWEEINAIKRAARPIAKQLTEDAYRKVGLEYLIEQLQ